MRYDHFNQTLSLQLLQSCSDVLSVLPRGLSQAQRMQNTASLLWSGWVLNLQYPKSGNAFLAVLEDWYHPPTFFLCCRFKVPSLFFILLLYIMGFEISHHLYCFPIDSFQFILHCFYYKGNAQKWIQNSVQDFISCLEQKHKNNHSSFQTQI